ncbi:iron-hydroxamate ABC transporter substrate-binding protein [Paenibacillus abyssi]
MLALAVFLAACGSNGNTPETTPDNTNQAPSETPAAGEETAATEKTVQDAMGNEVTIPANPERVLAAYYEDQLVTLGVKPVAQWSVANGAQDYLESDLQGIPLINYDLPPEAVAGFNPDFIIIGSSFLVQNGLYDQYAKIAPTYVLGDELIKDWRATLLKIGELLNKTDEANAAIQAYDQKVADTKAKLEQAVSDKSAAILWLTQKQFYMVDGNLSSGAVLYRDLGMKQPNLITDLPEEAQATWNPVSLEKLAELDADYIFLVNSDSGQAAETLDSPIWKGIPAVKEGHVYEMSTKSSWLYSGAIAGQKVMDDLLSALEMK